MRIGRGLELGLVQTGPAEDDEWIPKAGDGAALLSYAGSSLTSCQSSVRTSNLEGLAEKVCLAVCQPPWSICLLDPRHARVRLMR